MTTPSKFLSGSKKPYPKKSKAVINGTITNIKSYPYYAFVETNKTYCGGALVKRNIVVTAAHCISSAKVNQIKITLGLNSRKQKKRTVCRAKKVVIHPNYKYDKKFDIAVIVLKCMVKLTSTIRVIKLHKALPKVGCKIRLVGYGYTKCEKSPEGYFYLPAPSNRLRLSIRTILSFEGHIMTTGSKKSRTCLGDSGNPLTKSGQLVAVHSTGVAMCAGNSCHVSVAHPQIITFLRKYIS